MASVQRAVGPLMVAWLLATLSAVGVAWVAVHPAAEQGFADRPPVPQPGVIDPAPDADGSSGNSGKGGTGSARPGDAESRPAAPKSRAAEDDPKPTDLPSVSPTKPSKPPISKPPTGPPSAPPSNQPGTVYRSAEAQGGTATFEYDKSGDVYVVRAEPQDDRWRVYGYRYERDWVVVEFESYGHVSTIHAYLDRGRATIEVIEEGY